MTTMYRWTLAALLALPLLACRGREEANQAGPPRMQLATYEVPAAQGDRLEKALSLALNTRATVSQAGPGKLLVYAPADAQPSIADAIKALSKTAPAMAAVQALHIRFWVIDGVAGAGQDDPTLRDLAPSLEAVRRTVGPMHFDLNQQVAAAGESGNIKTLPDGRYQRVFNFRSSQIADDRIQLEMHFADDGPGGLRGLDTQLQMELGHYVMLAQAPSACPSGQVLNAGQIEPCTTKAATRLLVVRIDPVPAA